MRFRLGSTSIVKMDNGEFAIEVSLSWLAKLMGMKYVLTKDEIKRRLGEIK